MRRSAFCLFILVFVFCQLPFGVADGIELTDTQVGTAPEIPVDIAPDVPAAAAPTDTTQGESASAHSAKERETTLIPVAAEKESPTEVAKSDETAPPSADTEEADNDGTASPAEKDEKDGQKAERGAPADVAFASIHSKGLTVADGNRWYYESFDRQGRASFAMLYEDGTAIEKTVWTYQGAARYPEQKKILRKESSEIFRYNEQGKELTIERYEDKTLVSKTENVYNDADKLIEQTITSGKNTDRSVWKFVEDKVVSQTKYRNGKKTALIELHSTPHIVHLYVDDKEVYVGEEQ